MLKFIGGKLHALAPLPHPRDVTDIFKRSITDVIDTLTTDYHRQGRYIENSLSET
jgi:hypothetical protein